MDYFVCVLIGMLFAFGVILLVDWARDRYEFQPTPEEPAELTDFDEAVDEAIRIANS